MTDEHTLPTHDPLGASNDDHTNDHTDGFSLEGSDSHHIEGYSEESAIDGDDAPDESRADGKPELSDVPNNEPAGANSEYSSSEIPTGADEWADEDDVERAIPGGGADGDHATESTSTRFWLTNDALAALLLGSLPALLLASAAGLSVFEGVPGSVLAAYVTLLFAAGAWAFGPETIEAFRGE